MHHYTDCCLDNVWLTNGYSSSHTAQGKSFDIEDIDGLHEVMMSLEVGSILNMSEPFYFEKTASGWQRISQKQAEKFSKLKRKVA